MIDRATMMQLLTVACPGFKPTLDKFLSEWSDDPELPYYLALGDFCRYLIKLLEVDEREQLSAAFKVIEHLHIEGDHYVREAATIGILEDLQNTNLHERTEPEQFLALLGPVSTRFWYKVADFWENGGIITDD